MGFPATENDVFIQGLNNSDDAVFRLVYHRYHNAVFANIIRLVKRQEEAEDILQDVFVALWESRRKLTDAQSVAGWLFTTSYYKTLARIRQSLKQAVVLMPELPGELVQEQEENNEEMYKTKLAVISRAMETLPPRKRSAFELCRLEGKTYEEAATLLDISVESVKDYVKVSSTLIRKQVVESSTGMSALSVCLITLYL